MNNPYPQDNLPDKKLRINSLDSKTVAAPSNTLNPYQQHSVADADLNNWVDRFAPVAIRPYLQLMRADRPAGIWLFFLPLCCSLALAAEPGQPPSLRLMLLFFIFATAMRGAGCTINDIIDRDLDSQVERTRSRPIPSGRVSVLQAGIFAAVLLAIGMGTTLTLNRFTWMLTLASVLLLTLYPFMKRITWWPQAFLGITFNWGILLGWAAVHDHLSYSAWLLYAGGAFWTFGYDTIYAHQDKSDDEQANIRSSARALGSKSRQVVALSYAIAMILMTSAGLSCGLGGWFILALIPVGIQLILQISQVDLNVPSSCLKAFKSNQIVGVYLLIAFTFGQLMQSVSAL